MSEDNDDPAHVHHWQPVLFRHVGVPLVGCECGAEMPEADLWAATEGVCVPDSSPPPAPSPATPEITVREVSTQESTAMAAAGTFFRCAHGVAPFACTCGRSTPFQGYWTGEPTSRVFVEVPPSAPPASDVPAPPRECGQIGHPLRRACVLPAGHGGFHRYESMGSERQPPPICAECGETRDSNESHFSGVGHRFRAAACQCGPIAEAMLDGSHIPEGAEEWRAAHGHYKGCPASPAQEATPPREGSSLNREMADTAIASPAYQRDKAAEFAAPTPEAGASGAPEIDPALLEAWQSIAQFREENAQLRATVAALTAKLAAAEEGWLITSAALAEEQELAEARKPSCD